MLPVAMSAKFLKKKELFKIKSLMIISSKLLSKEDPCKTALTPVRMVRKFKHHEQRLLKKVDFLEYKSTDNANENLVIQRYHVQNREDYVKYNKICGYVSKLANELSNLPAEDPFRQKQSAQLLEKLYEGGLINSKASLSALMKLAVSSFCRRRLAVIVMKLKMAETLKEAVTFIEQGHIRVGPETIRDASFHVSRMMEDFITWVDSSKIRRKIAEFSGQVDDFDLLN